MMFSSAPPCARHAVWQAPVLLVLAGCAVGGCPSLWPQSPLRAAMPVGVPPVCDRLSGVPLEEGSDSARSASAPPPPVGGRDESPQELPPLTPARTFTPPPAPPDPKGGGNKAAKEAAEGQPREKDQEPDDKAKEKKEPWYSVHEQGTIVTQVHDHFHALYTGPNSLLPVEPSATSETATLFLDTRLWHGADLVFNPEIAGGRGLSNTLGLAGFPNGDISRVGEIQPTPYIARLFVRQAWGLGGEQEKVEDNANQIAGIRDRDRVTLIVGKMSATDFFDNNRYSHDPRTQFENWSIMYDGAWDYPANVRGYDYGVVLDLTTVFWAVRYGIFGEPALANGTAIDPHILDANGQILELQENYCLNDCPGVVREWVYLNHAHMGNYREALEEMPVNPDITLTRAYRFKYGIGANLEQQLTRELGLFLKVGWNDGHTETWAFTEIDETAAVGLLLKGKHWRRPNDEVGLAFVINGLSREHRDYLAAGGLGFIIGDGRLNYGPEEILETYYNWQLVKGINVALDFQGVEHPAFNRDRGPVAIGAILVHFEH